MGIMIQTEFRGAISSHLKLAVFQLVKNGDAVKEQIVDTGFSNVLFASGKDMRTGRNVRCKWEKGSPCVLVGPLTKTSEIIKVKVEGW